MGKRRRIKRTKAGRKIRALIRAWNVWFWSIDKFVEFDDKIKIY